MSTQYKRTDWVRRLEDFSSGCSSGFGLGQWLIAGILAIFTGISRLLPVTRWLSVTLSPAVPVVSTVGANSLKSPVSIWRGVVFVALVVGMMAMGHGALAETITLQPDAALGKDARAHSIFPNANAGSDTCLIAQAWTWQGKPGLLRSFIQFDLTSVPSDVTITTAKLSLYADTCYGISTITASNASVLQRVTSVWDENTITWNNQPSTTTNNQVLLSEISNPVHPNESKFHQDYPGEIDVTSLVRDMVANPSANFGFMFGLQQEQYYSVMSFSSSDATDPNLRPKLVVTYESQGSGTGGAVVIDADLTRIELGLRDQIINSANQRGDFIVRLNTQVATADLDKAKTYKDWAARGQYVYNLLKQFADNSQKDLLTYLQQQQQAGNVESYEAFFITNTVYVKNANLSVLDALSKRGEVKYLNSNKSYSLPKTVDSGRRTRSNKNWGIGHIKANDVWNNYTNKGEGIVVANIDAGVDYQNNFLNSQYRGTTVLPGHHYNWYDATGSTSASATTEPTEVNAHGTNVMGFMVGGYNSNYYGIAPKANWIAANACEKDNNGITKCHDANLIKAAQWILAPTKLDGTQPQAGKRPQIVNFSGEMCHTNSIWETLLPNNPEYWPPVSTNTDITDFHNIVKTWRAAGIFPVFGAGNRECPGTNQEFYIAAPGNFEEGLTVGAIDSSNNIYSDSSLPQHTFGSAYGKPSTNKPDVVAPGVNVSKLAGGTGSGTSYAAPHVAGCIALMRSAIPSISFEEVKKYLTETASQANSFDNTYGYGFIDCYAAVDKALNSMDPPCPQTPDKRIMSSGPWPMNVNDTDVVLVYHGITVTMPQEEVEIGTLCNYGTLQSAEDLSLKIIAPNGIYNYNTGIIKGQDGSGNCKEGSDVILQTASKSVVTVDYNYKTDGWWEAVGVNPGPIHNEGIIQGGNGSGGSCTNAGKGGNAIVLGRNVLNEKDYTDITTKNGQIIGGNGGTSTNGNGGNGGLVQVFGKLGGSSGNDNGGLLISTGTIHAGTGGNGTTIGGNGGNLWLVAFPKVYLGPDGTYTEACFGVTMSNSYPSCTVAAGHKAGGAGIPNGTSGKIQIEPSVISIRAGLNPEIQGGDVTIFGGDDFILDLHNLVDSQGHIVESTGNIILAVGKNGIVDLTGNTGVVLKAAGEVKIFADDIRTDASVNLSDIIQATNIVTQPSKILRNVLLTGTSQVTGQPNTVLPISLTLANGGPTADTYTISVTDSADWTFSKSMPVVPVEGVSIVEIGLDVIVPSQTGATNTLIITATSQNDSSTSSTHEVQVTVVSIPPENIGNYKTIGTILDNQHKPIVGSVVQVGNKVTTTNALGNWEIKGLHEGEYTITASKEGYTFEPAQVNLTGNETALQVTLVVLSEPEEISYTASGTLKDNAGQPIANATVQIGDKSVVSDENGNWEITGLAEGNYTATISKDGYTFESTDFNVADSNVELEVIIGQPDVVYSIHGTIKDDLNNPIADVTVQIGDKSVVTDAAGNWEITGLVEGEYTVTANKEGYLPDSKPCVVSVNEKVCQPRFKLEPVLDVKVVPEPRIAKQGEDVIYTITVTNQGEGTATDVTLVEGLPDNTDLVTIEALEGGSCQAETLTCSLPDLTSGATANVKVVVSNSIAETLINTVTVTTQQYPTDVKKTWTQVIPYLSVTVTDLPDPIEMLKVLHYSVAVELNHYAPTDATDVTFVSQLPSGVELKSINSDYGSCDTSAFPQISCKMNDLSIASADSVSHATVEMDVELKDGGLLLLTHQAKVTGNEYPAHLVRERTTIFIPEGIQVDLALVIDVTGSMQEEMNGVIGALTDFIDEIDTSTAPLMALLTFSDEVKVAAFTQDLDVLRGAIEDLTASGGGLCEEASIEALLVAIPHTQAGGNILFASDASPYPDANVDKVIELLRGKGIRFNAILTGDCTQKDSWNELSSDE